jgi:hypothetical protein
LLALLDEASVSDADEAAARRRGKHEAGPSATNRNHGLQRLRNPHRRGVSFQPGDTLVFHVTLRNKSELEIRYLPESFCVRVGNRLYHQSISDAPGRLPPHAASTVYFAITGTPDGGRNEISLKNEFSVLLSRLPSPPSAATMPPHHRRLAAPRQNDSRQEARAPDAPAAIES